MDQKQLSSILSFIATSARGLSEQCARHETIEDVVGGFDPMMLGQWLSCLQYCWTEIGPELERMRQITDAMVEAKIEQSKKGAS